MKTYGTQEVIPFFGGLGVDYGQIAKPTFTSDKIFEMGVNGTFFD